MVSLSQYLIVLYEQRGYIDKGIIHILAGMKQYGMAFHHDTQNGVQFKDYKCFISGIVHLMFSELGWWRVTEIKLRPRKMKLDKGGTPGFSHSNIFSFALLKKQIQ